MIRVAIIDDESLVASSLATLLSLEENIEILTTSNSGEHYLEWWRKQSTMGKPLPHVSVLDQQMPGLNGLETAQTLRSLSPRAAVLIVTSHAHPHHLRQAMSQGIQGYLPKTATSQQFAHAIHAVHRGERYIDSELAAWAMTIEASPLTPREAEVLLAAGAGSSVEEIATRVHLAPGTTRNYLSSAMSKVGATNRFEAYLLAREKRWL
ncbi:MULTISPECIES: response regulator transcription factor [unclassified Corynebacterium]|uniref:response regulator transcription factor n=1 Tax=unclassified Corynebacterium TaxID=2624378 RepID=UPI0029CA7B46|nr:MULTISPECIES: response regulator transcription factor [unclassified Corynebacterium]WPF66003.1 response regulator transcription factor [Corynebacterium sp. 22KM0430]WPF68496.1 response regulator transcription factor [Corynebacterium sp. 21KM1197]